MRQSDAFTFPYDLMIYFGGPSICSTTHFYEFSATHFSVLLFVCPHLEFHFHSHFPLSAVIAARNPLLP